MNRLGSADDAKSNGGGAGARSGLRGADLEATTVSGVDTVACASMRPEGNQACERRF